MPALRFSANSYLLFATEEFSPRMQYPQKAELVDGLMEIIDRNDVVVARLTDWSNWSAVAYYQTPPYWRACQFDMTDDFTYRGVALEFDRQVIFMMSATTYETGDFRRYQENGSAPVTNLRLRN